jgi:predicted site-specific integrase-resolvase
MQHVSIGQASELLGVAVSTLRRWEKEGRLRPSFRTFGRHRMHKDRLLRFGADIIFDLCKLNQTEVVILEEPAVVSIENRLVADVIELMTVFSARLYGAPSHKHRKLAA